MAAKIRTVFPSLIYQGQLTGKTASRLNSDLTDEIEALKELDLEGQKWSRRFYQQGYSSYSSMDRLHETSPNFSELEKLLRPHLKNFVKQLHWDLAGRQLQMTTCWANQMGEGSYHTMHVHPFCAVSGVYYVNAPRGSSAIKFEDPRLTQFMSAPPRKSSAPEDVRNFISIPPKAGGFLLFESWMRHEVPPQRVATPRLSISFNYEWF